MYAIVKYCRYDSCNVLKDVVIGLCRTRERAERKVHDEIRKWIDEIKCEEDDVEELLSNVEEYADEWICCNEVFRIQQVSVDE